MLDTVSYQAPDPAVVLRALQRAETAPVAPPQVVKVLRPFGDLASSLSITSRPVFMRDDPILRLALGNYRDEREWRAMERAELAVSTPVKAVIRRLLGDDFSIEKAKNPESAEKAQLYRDFLTDMYGRIDGIYTALDLAARTKYQGWTVFQVIPKAFTFRGETKWGIDQLVDQKQEFFSFVQDQGTPLAFLGDGILPPQIFDGAAADGWLVLRHGTSYSPFGRPEFGDLWFTVYVLRRFRELFQAGFRNAVSGVPILEWGGEAGDLPAMKRALGVQDQQSQAAFEQRMKEELEKLLLLREKLGALMVPAGFKLNSFQNIEGVQQWALAIADYKRDLQISIQGEELTSNVGPNGSRAQANVHRDTSILTALDAGHSPGST
jgi:hypothetical protein